ncbi:MAG: acyloxyacyl hydrolase [Desulfobacterales bacterium]
MKLKRLVLFCLAIVLLCACRAQGGGDNHLLGLGMGSIGVLDHTKVLFGSLEYRPNIQFYKFKPWFSLEAGHHLFYLSTGVLIDFRLSRRLLFTPGFGAGVYTDDREIDLGHMLEFQSSAEISYRFDNAARLALCYGHISNAGIDTNNPGTEMLKISYFVPFGK